MLEGDLGRLEDELCFVNDLLWCSVESLNGRLCECLMSCVVMRPVMENMVVLEEEEDREGTEDGDHIAYKSILEEDSLQYNVAAACDSN